MSSSPISQCRISADSTLGGSSWQMNPDVPVILTTGYSATLDVERARKLGFRDLLLKPYTIAALAESLRKALGIR